MAWCLTAPSHYLNQCWLIVNATLEQFRKKGSLLPWSVTFLQRLHFLNYSYISFPRSQCVKEYGGFFSKISRYHFVSHELSAEFILGNIKIDLNFSTSRWPMLLKYFLMDYNNQFILHCQCCGCWSPGDTMKAPGHQQPWCKPSYHEIFHFQQSKIIIFIHFPNCVNL